jgi:antitoxin YefM
MITTTLSAFRKDLKSYPDKLTQNFETLVVNPGKDTGVVIISIEQNDSCPPCGQGVVTGRTNSTL